MSTSRGRRLVGAIGSDGDYRQVLTALQDHAAVHDRLMHLALTACPRRKQVEASEWLDMREAVEFAPALVQVKAVVIDEAQPLLAAGDPVLTLEALHAHALAVGQRVRMEMETRTGERKVEESQAHSHHQLQQLLGTAARGQLAAAGAAPAW